MNATEEKGAKIVHIPYFFPSSLINPSAVLSYLPVGAGQRCNVTHLDHACHKICEKCALAIDIRLDLCVGGSAIEELLIRVQKSLLANKVLVVVVLKDGRGLKVQRCQIVVTCT